MMIRMNICRGKEFLISRIDMKKYILLFLILAYTSPTWGQYKIPKPEWKTFIVDKSMDTSYLSFEKHLKYTRKLNEDFNSAGDTKGTPNNNTPQKPGRDYDFERVAAGRSVIRVLPEGAKPSKGLLDSLENNKFMLSPECHLYGDTLDITSSVGLYGGYGLSALFYKNLASGYFFSWSENSPGDEDDSLNTGESFTAFHEFSATLLEKPVYKPGSWITGKFDIIPPSAPGTKSPSMKIRYEFTCRIKDKTE